MKARTLGAEQDLPIPTPCYPLMGDEERYIVINCALEDCRAQEPHANRPRVAAWVEFYLQLWERAKK